MKPLRGVAIQCPSIQSTIPNTGSTALRKLALSRSRWTIPKPSAQCLKMLMITSGSPKEPENEQQDAGQSQSSRIWDWNPKQSFAAIGSPVLIGALRDIRATASRGPMSQAVCGRAGHRWAKGVLGVLRTSEGHLAFSRGHSWSGVASPLSDEPSASCCVSQLVMTRPAAAVWQVRARR